MVLPLASSASLAFSLRFGLSSTQAFTRIMIRLHLCVIRLLFFPILSSPADVTRVSIGAGSAHSSRENALVANTSGCGWRHLLRQHYTFHCIPGRRVSGRSMKSTSLIGGTLIRELGRSWISPLGPRTVISNSQFLAFGNGDDDDVP